MTNPEYDINNVATYINDLLDRNSATWGQSNSNGTPLNSERMRQNLIDAVQGSADIPKTLYYATAYIQDPPPRVIVLGGLLSTIEVLDLFDISPFKPKNPEDTNIHKVFETNSTLAGIMKLLYISGRDEQGQLIKYEPDQLASAKGTDGNVDIECESIMKSAREAKMEVGFWIELGKRLLPFSNNPKGRSRLEMIVREILDMEPDFNKDILLNPPQKQLPDSFSQS